MSSSAVPTVSSATKHSTHHLKNIGLGYYIAIALAILVVISTVLLISYFCCRKTSRRRSALQNPNRHNSASDGVILPRVMFVGEESGGGACETAVVGLDEAVINSYPKFQFSRVCIVNGASTTCSICLCEFRDMEMLRMMPDCRHYFHVYCIDAWLKLNGTCPVCRNSPLPTPLSTPLSEVVPLSQHPADRRRRR